MSGMWLVSYVGLWLIVILLCLVTTGVLQQIGLLQRQLGLSKQATGSETEIPPPEQDGPDIGSSLPPFNLESVNSFGSLQLGGNSSSLLLFISPLCKSCQQIVIPLNTLVDSHSYRDQVVVFLRADDQTCQAFLNIFPLHVPVIQDQDGTFTKEFAVHRSPFGLLYGAEGSLLRKGVVANSEELLDLVGAIGELSKKASPR